MSEALRLRVVQFAPRLGAPTDNAAAIAARSGDADLVLTPELSLTGYDVRDAVHHLGVRLEVGSAVPRDWPHGDAAVVVGVVEQGTDRVPYNTAAVIHSSRLLFRHRKIYLPTYGMFDEMRYFGRGRALRTFELHGWRIGIAVCEDFWHPGLVYALAAQGIDLLLVQAAAPGRDVWNGDDTAPFASASVWERIARVTAQCYGICVALSNRIGVEGAVTFAGGSLVVGPDGSVLARAGAFDDTTLDVTLDRGMIAAARRPYAHIRDDEPALVVRALTEAGLGA